MIIPDLQKSCKYTTQNAYILFILLPLKLTSSMAQLSNPDNLHWCNTGIQVLPVLSLHPFFLFQNSIQDSTLHVLSMSPWSPPVFVCFS